MTTQEWLCDTCKTIHTPPKNLNLLCKTPGCCGMMRPTSFTERRLEARIAELEEIIEALRDQVAEAKADHA